VSQSDLVAFVRAVERGGFSAAARDLDLTPSAVSKLVTRLEDRLGVRLLNRTTRSLALTAEGDAFFHRAQRILADIAEAEEEVGRSRAQPRGLLRVNVGTAFGMHQLAPALPDFFARHPEIQVELTITDRVVDLVEEGADIGIRMGTLPDSSLVARRIAEVERVICAAPSYLRRHGTPRKPADLRAHNCLNMANTPALRRWPFESAGGVEPVEVGGNLTPTSSEALH
jgi:DNA-binding transcriptional LysR family regulator